MKSKMMIAVMLAGASLSVSAGENMQAKVEELVAASFKPGEGQDMSRLKQDDTQKLCSATRNNPSQKDAEALLARERDTIKYPADNKLMGDWKEGEKLVKGGFGMRIGAIEPDPVKKQSGGNGGNCYACHAVDPKEVAAGNLGPSLTGYGKLRGQSEDIVKYTYEKIYNAQAFVACSSMTRLGHNGVLKPEQIAHITAYLISQESPVNK